MQMHFNNPFGSPGTWLKGNLHAHTAESDGKPKPEEAVKHYREAGYDFLSITDHNKLTEVPESGLLLIPGEEIDFGYKGHTFHFIALGIKKSTNLDPRKRRNIPPQNVIERIRSCGGETILAHPYWSNESLKATELCKGILGLEVYNHCSQTDAGIGHSMVHWDDLLRLGWNVTGVAVDDTHTYGPKEFSPDDSFGGWVKVKALKRDLPSIMSALKNGMFYSSSGPEFVSVDIKGQSISVETSAVRSVTFRTPQWGGRHIERSDGSLITRAEFVVLNPDIRCVRIQCTDDKGRMAWLNPIFLE